MALFSSTEAVTIAVPKKTIKKVKRELTLRIERWVCFHLLSTVEIHSAEWHSLWIHRHNIRKHGKVKDRYIHMANKREARKIIADYYPRLPSAVRIRWTNFVNSLYDETEQRFRDEIASI